MIRLGDLHWGRPDDTSPTYLVVSHVGYGVFPRTLETDSLVLCHPAHEGVNVFELYDRFREGSDDAVGVFEYVPQEPHATLRDAREQLAEFESTWEEGRAALYAVVSDGDALAGVAGLSVDWDRQVGSPGVTLARPFWGEGYAGECARVLTDLAFERLDLELVAIGHEAGNERSKCAIRKFVDAVGGRYEGRLRNRTPLGDRVADHHRYTVSREEYRQAIDG